MKKLLALLLLVAGTFAANAVNITLEWDPNPESNVSGYRAYRGDASRVYTDVGEVAAPLVKFTQDYPIGRHFVAVTAFDSDGLESEFSEELTLDSVAAPAWIVQGGNLVWAVSDKAHRVKWVAPGGAVYYQVYAAGIASVPVRTFPGRSIVSVQIYDLSPVINTVSDYGTPFEVRGPAAPRNLRAY